MIQAYNIAEFSKVTLWHESEVLKARRKRNLARFYKQYDDSDGSGTLWRICLNSDHNESLDMEKGGCYEVPLSRMTTPAAFVNWLVHLSDKEWFTAQMQADFITELFDALVAINVSPHDCGNEWNWPEGE